MNESNNVCSTSSLSFWILLGNLLGLNLLHLGYFDKVLSSHLVSVDRLISTSNNRFWYKHQWSLVLFGLICIIGLASFIIPIPWLSDGCHLITPALINLMLVFVRLFVALWSLCSPQPIESVLLPPLSNPILKLIVSVDGDDDTYETVTSATSHSSSAPRIARTNAFTHTHTTTTKKPFMRSAATSPITPPSLELLGAGSGTSPPPLILDIDHRRRSSEVEQTSPIPLRPSLSLDNIKPSPSMSKSVHLVRPEYQVEEGGTESADLLGQGRGSESLSDSDEGDELNASSDLITPINISSSPTSLLLTAQRQNSRRNIHHLTELQDGETILISSPTKKKNWK